MAAHHEVHLETYITKKLVENGWIEGTPDAYDRHLALYTEDVITWVQKTQPDAWKKVQSIHGDNADKSILDRLERALNAKTGGTMKVFRDGFSVAGAGTIAMSQRAPEDKNNPKVVARYSENILRVVRQVKYNPTREWEIDLVFFINGLPVATVELKTDFTQSIDNAIKQYKADRLPQDPISKKTEPLLTFKRGAVVHFAMSDSEIAMTTRLAGQDTFFLPFNKGNHGHAGNASRDDGEYPVAYFWEDICQRDTWLRIFTNFVYVETKDKVDKRGRPYKSETQIFPRYHQLEAVNSMVDDVRKKGAGNQYLFEHSAGSGKTNTIAWTAHDLIRLRKEDGTAHFNSVIIVTDRNVLDAQLQEAVQQLDHQYGVIEAIDRKTSNKPKSQQLADAMRNGAPIIVVTIQTFPFAIEAIITDMSLKDRNFAVIIDEAHTSQTGSTAQGLRAALSLESKDILEEMTTEELLLEIQKSRVQPKNVSHFAFTATPKAATKTLFGRVPNASELPSKDNKPESFHVYTQRQAIEEGFILDVLENYTPYQQAFQIGQNGVSDKRVDKKIANRELARWKSLEPASIVQKVEFIMNHFHQNVQGLLNGEAKAMVVTSGRPQAVKYKLAFDKYIQKNELVGLKALVAFSGKVDGKLLGKDDGSYGIEFDKEYTEYNLNPDMGSQDLRHMFEQHAYRVMIVANKFQTGFNQPKLVAMYLDKKISGVEAVQTLSRLNRTYPGKDQTFVIDFANEPQTIIDAFKSYDEGAELSDVQDPNVVYDIRELLDEVNIYNTQDLEDYKKASEKALIGNTNDESLHRKMYSATQRAADVYNAKFKSLTDTIRSYENAFDVAHKAGDKKAEEIAESKRSDLTKERETLNRFKSNLGRFVRVYSYVSQLLEMSDADLENFAGFARLLAKRLKGISPEQIDLSGLVLKGFAIKKRDIPDKANPTLLDPITGNDSDATDREKLFLEELIEQASQLFGEITPQESQLYLTFQIVTEVKKDMKCVEQIDKNSREQALKGEMNNVVRQQVVSAMNNQNVNARTLLKDSDSMDKFIGMVHDIIKHGDDAKLSALLGKMGL
jgi:type I restriction enzyme R subunit